MMRALVVVAAFAICATTVLADPVNENEVSSNMTWLVGELPLGGHSGGPEVPFDPNDRYSNIGTFTGAIANQQPLAATATAGISITRALMDDVHAISNVPLALNDTGAAGSVIVSMGNANSVAVAARMRVRVWDADGAGGGPGTYHGGFSSTNNLNCNANTACLFRFARSEERRVGKEWRSRGA